MINRGGQGWSARRRTFIRVRIRLVAAGAAAATVAAGLVGVAAHGVATDSTLTADGVTAAVTATTARLTDGLVTRDWAIGGGSVTTTALRDAGGTNWAQPGPDFQITIGDASTSSTAGWSLIYATAQQLSNSSGRQATEPV